MSQPLDSLAPTDSFARRHTGADAAGTAAMLAELGYPTVDALVDAAVPAAIRRGPLTIPAALGESAALAELRGIAAQNQVFRSFIGLGYHGTHTPGVVQRTILENPGWYTAYTPYQAEIAQGRLEALLNFQTVVCDLTGLEIANASMLDEGTAAAEAMMMCHRLKEGEAAAHRVFFVSERCHPQTIDIVRTRALPLGVEVVIGDHRTFQPGAECFGVLVQYPDTTGSIHDFTEFFAAAHAAGAFTIAATDLLALTLLRAPGEFGADVAVGSAQRFGVPLGFGGPHAGFLATKDAFKRQMPGRLVGVSKDAQGDPALPDAGGARGSAHIDRLVGVALHDRHPRQRQVEFLGHHLRPADVGALSHVDLADPADGAAVSTDADIGCQAVGLHRQTGGHNAGPCLHARKGDGDGQSARACQKSTATGLNGHGFSPASDF